MYSQQGGSSQGLCPAEEDWTAGWPKHRPLTGARDHVLHPFLTNAVFFYYSFSVSHTSMTLHWQVLEHLWAKYLRSVNMACFLCMVKFACRSYNLWELLSSDLMLLTFLSTWTAQRRLARAAEHCIGLFWGHLTPTYNDAVFSLS